MDCSENIVKDILGTGLQVFIRSMLHIQQNLNVLANVSLIKVSTS